MCMHTRKRCSRWGLITRSFNWEFGYFVWGFLRGTHHDDTLASRNTYDRVVRAGPPCSRIHENRNGVIDRWHRPHEIEHQVQMACTEELLSSFEAKTRQFALNQVFSVSHDLTNPSVTCRILPSEKIQRKKSVRNTYPYQYSILFDQDDEEKDTLG